MIFGCSRVSRSSTRSLSWPMLFDSRLTITIAAGRDGQSDHFGRRRGMPKEVDDADQRLAQLDARNDQIDHAVIAQVFGALETLRQLLADRLLDHSRAGKSD